MSERDEKLDLLWENARAIADHAIRGDDDPACFARIVEARRRIHAWRPGTLLGVVPPPGVDWKDFNSALDALEKEIGAERTMELAAQMTAISGAAYEAAAAAYVAGRRSTSESVVHGGTDVPPVSGTASTWIDWDA